VNDLQSLLKDDVGCPGYGLQPSGSVASNPNVHAPSLYLELDDYEHPVVCPHSTTDESESPSLPNVLKTAPPKGSQIEELLVKTVQSDALTKVCSTHSW
jgi:hypothetical protein